MEIFINKHVMVYMYIFIRRSLENIDVRFYLDPKA